jgi:hypothetical protein
VHDPLSTGGAVGVLLEPEPPHPARESRRTIAQFRIAPIKHRFIFPLKFAILVLAPARLRAQ